MSAHKELNSKDDFDAAIATSDKYVFIYAYEGEVDALAERQAKAFSDKVDAYKVDVSKQAKAKDYFGISKVPTAIVFKDGKEVKKASGMDPADMQEIGKMFA